MSLRRSENPKWCLSQNNPRIDEIIDLMVILPSGDNFKGMQSTSHLPTELLLLDGCDRTRRRLAVSKVAVSYRAHYS